MNEHLRIFFLFKIIYFSLINPCLVSLCYSFFTARRYQNKNKKQLHIHIQLTTKKKQPPFILHGHKYDTKITEQKYYIVRTLQTPDFF